MSGDYEMPSPVKGNGDQSDVDTGRCCPYCRNSLQDHNRAVYDAAWSMYKRHHDDELAAAYRAGQADAWDEGHLAGTSDMTSVIGWGVDNMQGKPPDKTTNPYRGGDRD